MRIGFDAKRAFHNHRGLGSYSRTIFNGLLQYYPEIENILFTPAYKNEIHGVARFLDKTQVITPTGAWSIIPSAWRRKKITSLLYVHNIDIYHGLSHELPLGIEKWSGKKLVTIHDLQYLRFPEFFSWIDRRIYASKVKHACSVADTVIAICEQTKSDLIEFLEIPEEKIVVHYQSCNKAFFPENRISTDKKAHDKPYILNVGAFVPNKNQLNLVKAFHQVANDISHDLILIGQRGSSNYLNHIKQYILKNQLGSRVHILQDVPFDELVTKYQQAEVFCFPSIFEGFGIPVVEAMFSGVPVITSHGSSLSEVGGAAAFYVDPNIIEEIASGIKKLAKPGIREEMIEKGLIQAQRFHLKNSIEELVKIYRS